MSPCILLCRPGYTYVALDTLMLLWLHLYRPGYTYVPLDTQVQYISTVMYFVSTRYTKVSTKLMYVNVHKCTVCELRSSAPPPPPQRDVGIQ